MNISQVISIIVFFYVPWDFLSNSPTAAAPHIQGDFPFCSHHIFRKCQKICKRPFFQTSSQRRRKSNTPKETYIMLKRIKGYKEGNDILKSNLHVLAPNIWGTFLQYHSTRLRRRSIITRATRERVCGRVAAELLEEGKTMQKQKTLAYYTIFKCSFAALTTHMGLSRLPKLKPKGGL